MRLSQHWIARLLAGWCSVGIALAQQDTGATGGTSGAGASSAFGSAAPSKPSGTGAGPSAPGATSSPATLTGSGTTATPATGDAGAASTFGAGATPKRAEEAPSHFEVSTGYGKAPQVFVSGEGRLAKPRFETTFATSIGFDDNVFQTPTNAQAVPQQVIVTEVQPAVPDQTVFVVEQPKPQVHRFGITPPPQQPKLVPVVIKGHDAVFEEVVIPGVPAPKRQASAINRGTLTFNAQMASRRSLFTFDLNANADYYWNRPNDKTDYNGSLALIYLQRLSPRMQFTASVNASYQSQPDYTQINTPTNATSGEYLNVTSKFDLSYRWTPRFSTVTSLGYNRLIFVEKASQSGDYAETTFGTELRYLWSPRFTGVVEGRYSQFRYENNKPLDSDSYYALLGFDIIVTRRATGTVRVGASMRQFDESGKKSTAPYLETTLVYQLGKASVLSWDGRFGFEEPPDANSEVLSLRSSVRVTHFFTPRLQGSISLNGIQQVTTNDLTDDDTTRLTFDSTVSLKYTLTRHWTLNGYYTFTNEFNDPDVTNFFRNRVFIGAEYEF